MMRQIIILIFLLFSSFTVSEMNAKDGVKGKVKGNKKELIVELTADSYDKLTSEGVVFVDFWAAWCAPCRRMNPILQEVAEECEGKVTIAKLNVDEFRDLAESKQVYSLPTIIIYKNGKELARAEGLISKQKLLEVVDYLSSGKK